MEVNRSEVLRYLRMGNVQPDAVLEARLSAVEREVLAAFDANGLTVVNRRESGGWLCFEVQAIR